MSQKNSNSKIKKDYVYEIGVSKLFENEWNTKENPGVLVGRGQGDCIINGLVPVYALLDNAWSYKEQDFLGRS